MAACRVSYVDFEGFRHSVELEAESLYEAAVLAVSAFRQHAYMSQVTLQILRLKFGPLLLTRSR